MRSLEELDRWIAGKVKRLSSNVAGVPQKKEVLEIRREILEDVRNRIEPKGSGKYLFPYNEIAIHLGAQNALADDDSLREDVRALLIEAGCTVPSSLTVDVDVVLNPEPFRIDYLNRKSRPQRASRPTAKLTVVRGSGEPSEYVIASDRVNMGRLKEVIGEKEGLRRRNDVAFPETESTVSREHAYIGYDSNTGKFRVCDYQSTRGTSVFRGGRRIEVPRASARGVQLQSGDEIHLGEARIRFEIAEP